MGGGDVGTDDFVEKRANERVSVAVGKIKKIMAIKEELPQMTLRMLTQCGNVLLDYLARVTPPSESSRRPKPSTEPSPSLRAP